MEVPSPFINCEPKEDVPAMMLVETADSNNQIGDSCTKTGEIGCSGLDTNLIKLVQHTKLDPPKMRPNGSKSVASAKSKRSRSRSHGMTLRSLPTNGMTFLSGDQTGAKSRFSAQASLRSFNSNTTTSSQLSNVSDSQIVDLYQTKKTFHERKIAVEKKQLCSRLEEEKQTVEEAIQQEEERILKQYEEEEKKRKLMLEEEELKRKLMWEEEQLKRKTMLEEEKRQEERQKEAIKQQLEDLRRKRDTAKRSFEQRKQQNLREINDRSEREGLELDAIFSETMIERGMKPTLGTTQNDAPTTSGNTFDINQTPPVVKMESMQPTPVSFFRPNMPETGMSTSTKPFGNSICPLPECSVSVMNGNIPSTVGSTGKHNLANSNLLREPALIEINSEPQMSPAQCATDAQVPDPYICEASNGANVHIGANEHVVSPNQFPNRPQLVSYVVPQTLLPPFEPPTFSGDPSEFSNFLDLFETAIGSKIGNQKQKLAYLMQYTNGPARALVKGCLHLGPDKCYSEALKLLQETYGQRFQVGQSCLNTIVNGPQIKLHDRDGLTMFSANLISCVNTFRGIGFSSVPLVTIDKISQRMPYQWRAGWLSIVDHALHVLKGEVNLENLSNYARKKVREISNIPPQETHSTFSKPVIAKPTKSNFAATMYTTEVPSGTSTPSNCIKCNEKHFLNQCHKFRALDVKKRWDFVREHKLCFSCLKPGHWSKQCSRDSPCRYPDCNKKHTTLLHIKPDDSIVKNKTEPVGSKETEIVSPKLETEFSAFVRFDERVLLDVLPVRIRIRGSKEYITTNAFFDTGSHGSFISEKLMKQLNVHGPQTEFNLRTLHGESSYKSMVINDLELSNYDGSEYLALTPLLSIPQIGVENSDIPCQEDVNQFPEFQDVHIPQINSGVDLLIGKDNSMLHRPIRVVHGPKGYYATLTKAGWMLNCPSKAKGPIKSYLSKTAMASPHPICQMCTDFLDSSKNEKNEFSPNQTLFLNSVEKSIKLRADGHYEIKLPLKDDNQKFPYNRSQAEQRMQSLARRFKRDPAFQAEYCEFVNDMISNSYAERVEGVPGLNDKTWYVCHHGVYHPEKKKIRVVFDCSAKYDNISLNDALLQGPDLTNQSGTVHCAILRGKSRLVPLHGSTIPRLELSAATLSVRNDKCFRNELKLPTSDSFLWTDSTIVLCYIANSNKSNVDQITAGSTINQWRYVPSSSNPADIASRGLTAESLMTCSTWIRGPTYLWRCKTYWPKQPDFLSVDTDKNLEVKDTKKSFKVGIIENDFIDRTVSRCSSWMKLKRNTSQMLCYRNNLKLQIVNKKFLKVLEKVKYRRC